MYVRAIQGHTGATLTAPELMGHAAIPYKWKEFLFHRGCSCNVTSILTSGLIAGGRESKEGRQTVFFTPLNPFGYNPDKAGPSDDLSKPRKVHHYSKWKTRQDAVCWINLARAQDKGLQFWQTRSNAVIVHNSVPTDCIFKVISQRGERTLFQRLSTPRPAPKIVLKSARQPQQQQDTSESSASGTRKLERRDESTVETEPEFKVDFRIEGIAQDVILKDDERMGKIQEVEENEERLMHEIYSGRSEKTQTTP